MFRHSPLHITSASASITFAELHRRSARITEFQGRAVTVRIRLIGSKK
jgi:hypothetical protein